MNPRLIPPLGTLPDGPFYVSFRPREERRAYGAMPSFRQKATLDAFDFWIKPMNCVSAAGVLECHLQVPAGAPVIDLTVELRNLSDSVLGYLPVSGITDLREVERVIPDPGSFQIIVHRKDEEPEMIYSDAIVLFDGKFYMRSFLDKSRRRVA